MKWNLFQLAAVSAGLLTERPSDESASAMKFYWIQSPWKVYILYEMRSEKSRTVAAVSASKEL